MPASSRPIRIFCKTALAACCVCTVATVLAEPADNIKRGAPPLPVITSNRRENNLVKLGFRAAQNLSKAELNFTPDDKAPWPEKKWTSIPAHVKSDSATAELPEDARIYFITLWDDRGLPVSTEYGEIDSETTESTAATSGKEMP